MSIRCPQCGAELNAGSKFCTTCGTPIQQQAAPQYQQATPQYQQAPQYQQQAQYQQAPQFTPADIKSGYDGSVFDTFVNAFIAGLIISVSCGIATPWAVVYMYKFILSHVKIDGRRLTFTGTGAGLFGNWIVWMLLTVVTCGIYSFWVAPKMYNWIASNTHFDEK